MFHWLSSSLGHLAADSLRDRESLASKTIRSSILPPEGMEVDRWAAAAISPDGKYLVFGRSARLGRAWPSRRIDSLSARPLPGTDGAQSPFWSPDSRWIAFVAGGKLRKISIEGGSPLIICSGAGLRGGSWSPSGTILFVPGTGNPLFSVPDAGGTPVAITQLDQSLGELTHRWPVFLPDGKHFIYSAEVEKMLFMLRPSAQGNENWFSKMTRTRFTSPPVFSCL